DEEEQVRSSQPEAKNTQEDPCDQSLTGPPAIRCGYKREYEGDEEGAVLVLGETVQQRKPSHIHHVDGDRVPDCLLPPRRDDQRSYAVKNIDKRERVNQKLML